MHAFPICDGGIVLSLRSRLSALAAIGDRRADLLGAYNLRVQEVTDALGRLLQALSVEANARGEKRKPQKSVIDPDVLRHLQDLTYRLAEAYEFYRHLPDKLEVKSTHKSANRKFKAALRSVSRVACLICNKIKHSNEVLSRVDNEYDIGIYVEGFALMSRGRDASVKLSQDLHKASRPGISFNIGIRGLLVDFLRADFLAGRICSVLGAEENQQPDSALLDSLRILNSRPEIGLRFERSQVIPAMWEQSGSYLAGMKFRELPPLGNKVQTIQTMSGDGYTRTFPLAE